MSASEKLSTAPFSLPKKSGTKRELSPYDPYKRKARGKENNPGSLGTGLSARERGCACTKRDVYRKRAIEMAVRETVAQMHGTRRNPAFDGQGWKDPCDERLWANFAHATGDEKALQELCRRALSEYKASTVPKPVSELPKILGRHIKDYCEEHNIDLSKRRRRGSREGRGNLQDGASLLDVQPYREELSCCSPAMREIARGVALDMRNYMEDRI